ncbi:phosphoribosylaminoimidazolesuccinocarboxamide synthase [Ferroacidibacillus organovorans]|uniref:Phosphoribosylaminoimidazole-succinocarboxamide synthase n=1 Tax=Ferroacidibacillus organovorans TaxID=1765683 RepID=A0A117SXK7_9BACL|nr:phosphoribosylaminoimidazolesuccinocarboxamide synthase [Ferroacidibacillus organovorans]KUO95418.1 phosphoribosylaminoimidazolesuccinocarboxamide synthase [Ferroacidibacillus organovorans]
MEKGHMIYEGKAKRVYEVIHSPETVIVEYKDDATAFNGAKHASLEGKGVLNLAISTIIFEWLKQAGIASHYIRTLSDREMLVRRVEIVPLEVVVRNRVAGSLAKRLGIAEGVTLTEPFVEWYYKNDDLGDPLVTEAHIRVLGVATPEILASLETQAQKINQVLRTNLHKAGIELVDAKFEFGLTQDGTLILADEISPDTCRFWDTSTEEKLDKDRFRRDLGGVMEAYQEILRRIKGVQA